MNGPVRMYRQKPIVRRDISVTLPECMYKLQNIHAARNNTVVQQYEHVPPSDKKLDIIEQVKQFLKNRQDMPEMAALEERQQQILSQLAELKKQMLALKNHLKTNNNTPNTHSNRSATQKTFVCPIETSKLPDLVVNASPAYPPYSLEIVKKLWKDALCMSVKTYTHSSVTLLPENAINFAVALESFKKQSNLPTVNVRLIWKDVGANTELVISKSTIFGEVNILRFLSRIGPASLNYETYSNSYEIDALLDNCYRLVRAKTKTERAKLLQTFNKSLGKSQWMFDRKSVSWADVAAVSAIKQVAANEIGAGLGKWLQRCEGVA